MPTGDTAGRGHVGPSEQLAVNRPHEAYTPAGATSVTLSAPLSAGSVLALQRGAGNAAVSALLSRSMLARNGNAVYELTAGGYATTARKGSGDWRKAATLLEKQPRLHGAEVSKVEVADGVPDRCTFKLTVGQESVNVTMRIAPKPAQPAQAGTMGQPPTVAVTLPQNQTPGTAQITIDAYTDYADIPFIVGHELDEIADAVVNAGGGGGGAAQGPGIFVPAGAPAGAQATSRDRASALELVNLVMKGTHGAVVDRLKAAMGLEDTANTALKQELLQEAYAAVPQERRQAFEQAQKRDNPIAALLAGSVASAQPQLVFLQDPGLMAHVLYPEPSDDFASKGISGGHFDPALQAYAAKHPDIDLRPVKTKALGGGQCIEYEQWTWPASSGVVPQHRPSRGDPTGWLRAKVQKHAVTDIDALLSEVEAAITAWHTNTPPTADEANGSFTVPRGGFVYEGWYQYVLKTNTLTLKSVYPTF